MTSQLERQQVFLAIRVVFLVGAVPLLSAAVFVGGMAWLLGLVNIGLSIDARFLMSTMLFCAFAGLLSFLVVGLAITAKIENQVGDDCKTDETASTCEADAEEVAHRVIAILHSNQTINDFLRDDMDEALPLRPPRHSRKPAANRKRR